MSALLHLALTFGMLSILAVGGGTAVLPEMQIALAVATFAVILSTPVNPVFMILDAGGFGALLMHFFSLQ